MASKSAIACRGVVKEFGSGSTTVQALRGVDLEVRFGQITLLVGPSGCGKTTLLSAIAGLLAPTRGVVEVLGTRVADLPDRGQVLFRRQNLGFIFQQYNLLPALTAAENAAVGLLAAGVRRAEAVDRARALLARLGLESRADAYPAQLSGGQQQRVAVARALLHEPRIVLCDEPTAALDARSGHAVMDLMAGVALRPDRAVVVVTHDNRIFEFGDRLVHMEDGAITRCEDGPGRGAWAA